MAATVMIDDVIQLSPLRSQLLINFAQISDACFVHQHLQNLHRW